MQNDVVYQKLFSVISGHFLTQALPTLGSRLSWRQTEKTISSKTLTAMTMCGKATM